MVGLLGHVVVVVLLVDAGMSGNRHVPRVLVAIDAVDVGLVQVHVRRRAFARLQVDLSGVDGGDLDLRDRVLRRRVFHVGRQVVVLLVVESGLLLAAG